MVIQNKGRYVFRHPHCPEGGSFMNELSFRAESPPWEIISPGDLFEAKDTLCPLRDELVRQMGKRLLQKTELITSPPPPLEHPIVKLVLTFSLDGFRMCDPLRLEVEVDLGLSEDGRSPSQTVTETILPAIRQELRNLGEDLRRTAYATDRLRPPEESID